MRKLLLVFAAALPLAVAGGLVYAKALSPADGKPERALTLGGSGAALRHALVVRLPDSAKTRLERSLDAARETLTGSAAAASWMRGWTMPIEQVVQFALDQPKAGGEIT